MPNPSSPAGRPLPRFPWLGWGLSALLLPVGLLLILHLSGLLVARTLERPAGGEQGADGQTPGQPSGQTAASPLPPHVERFYSIVRHAPTVVILLSLLIFGGLLLFVDGLVETLGRLGGAMMVYLPWIVGGARHLPHRLLCDPAVLPLPASSDGAGIRLPAGRAGAYRHHPAA